MTGEEAIKKFIKSFEDLKNAYSKYGELYEMSIDVDRESGEVSFAGTLYSQYGHENLLFSDNGFRNFIAKDEVGGAIWEN